MNFKKWLIWENVDLEGEYWIQEDGSVVYADGDIGDYNHEAYVIQRLQGEITGEFNMWLDNEFIDWDKVKKDMVEIILQDANSPQEKKKWQEIGEYNPDELIEFYLKNHGDKDIEEKMIMANGYGDAREYAMQKWNWKRMVGNYIESWTMTLNDMRVIAAGVEEVMPDHGEEIDDEDVHLSISEYQTGNRYDVTLGQLKRGMTDANISGGLKSVAYANDMSRSSGIQTKEMDVKNMHPAYHPNDEKFQNPYGRKGVNPIGDWTIR